jgi:3-oxoacyl-[acyl-carrier protein] reductase
MKRALVTGGTGAIGAAICRHLAAQGLDVTIHSNTRLERAQQLADEIVQSGGSAKAVRFDVTDSEETATQLQQLLEQGPIQVLINNAGIHADAPLAGMGSEQWRSVIDVSLNGFYNVTQPLLLPMMSTRWGRIISLSSIAAITGNRGQANYAAAKAALHGASKSLAHELASRGVTVNVVAPGIIESPMSEQSFPAERIKQLVPMQSAQVISINGAMT